MFRKPTCTIVSMTSKPVETVVAAWLNSRDFRMPNEPWTKEGLIDRIVQEFLEFGDKCVFKFVADRSWDKKAINDLRMTRKPEGPELLARDAEDNLYFVRNLRRAFEKMVVDLFFDVVAQEIPISEFVMFNLSFENCPRAFVEQLDRERDAGFWEKSGRVIPFENFYDSDYYHIPPSVASNPRALEIYKESMRLQQEAFKTLKNECKIPGEDARGIIGIHANTSADMVVSLRILRKIWSKRSCFFAQGDYWRPHFITFLHELMNSPISEMPRDIRTIQIFTGLPCDKTNSCPYEKTMIDRIEDQSSPVCPIYFSKYAVDHGTVPPEDDIDLQKRILAGMDRTYGLDEWMKLSHSYLESLSRPSHSFDRLVQIRIDSRK